MGERKTIATDARYYCNRRLWLAAHCFISERPCHRLALSKTLTLIMFFPSVVARVANLLLLLAIFGVSHSHVLLPRATVCNGQAELCSRSYGNVTFVGAHDSYAIGPITQREWHALRRSLVLTFHQLARIKTRTVRIINYVISPNYLSTHAASVTRQLNDGIRMLQMQAHLQNNVINLCHTTCVRDSAHQFTAYLTHILKQSILNGGTLQSYLTTGI